MPYAQSDGARLYYEGAGSGTPIVFLHEFSGDLWSWENQIQHFSRRHQCVAFNARGYPPSDVPTSPANYSHSQAVIDVAEVMRHLKLDKAHVVGCSMGSRTALDFALRYPQMAMSVTMIGIGSGGDPRQADFEEKAEARAKLYEEGGLAEVLNGLSDAPNRVQLKRKNPRAFADFCQRFMNHSAQGNALVTRYIMARRPSLFSMDKDLTAMKVPGLVLVGDEDDAAVEAGLFLKQVSTAIRLAIAPATGHLVNLEEPDLMHRLTEDFFALVESKAWRPRGM